MKINISIFMVIAFLLKGCIFMPRDSKLDPLTFSVSNNCKHAVLVFFPHMPKDSLGFKVLPGFVESATAAARRPGEAKSYDEHLDYMVESFIIEGSKIIIQHDDNSTEILSVPEFILKSEAQMGKAGRGQWILTLCPTTS